MGEADLFGHPIKPEKAKSPEPKKPGLIAEPVKTDVTIRPCVITRLSPTTTLLWHPD